MKKIIYVITKSNFGGAQRYVYDLAVSLPRDVFDVTVAFGGTGAHGAGAGNLATLLAEAGVHTLFIKNFARDIFLLKEIAAFFELVLLFKKERPDVVHLNSSKAGGLGALAARIAGVPKIIFTAHGWPHHEPRNLASRALIYFFSWLTVLLSHQTIVVSENDLRTAPALFKKKSLVMIHNGIGTSVAMKTKDTARKELAQYRGAPLPQGIWILAVAELTRNKNVSALIRALKDTPNVSLVIIGGGELKDALKRLAKESDIEEHVHFLGHVPHADLFLPAADLFVLPSLKEGLPFALLEAGRAGLPVIASNVGGIPEIVEHEKNGLLVDPKDSRALAGAIKRLINDEAFRAKLGASLKQKIERDFSLDSMLAETSALYT